MTSFRKHGIHRYIALQQAKEQGVRAVAFDYGGKIVTGYVPSADEDWAAHAAKKPGVARIICGVTGVDLWCAPKITTSDGGTMELVGVRA